MKKLLLILLIVPLLAQVDHDLRVRVEQAKDDLSKAHSLIWAAGTGEMQGVQLTEQQKLDAVRDYESLINGSMVLLMGIDVPDTPAAPVFDADINELIFGADKYFWLRPRADSVEKVKAALSGDVSGCQFLIDNASSRIYKDYKGYVIEQLTKIVGG